MKIQELYLKDYQQTIKEAIQNKEDIVLWAVLPKNIVYQGKGEIDAKYCKKHDIDVYKSVDFGGGIVGFNGDIVLVILKQEGWDVGVKIIEKVKDYLTESGLNAGYNNNDILIDGIYKVASHSSVNVGDRFIYTGVQITFNADPEIIKHICMKNSVKVPRGLSYYSVDKNKILEFIIDYLQTV